MKKIDQYKSQKPETFARFLQRQKFVFAVAFIGYVGAYLVRNNFKVMSDVIMQTNNWEKSQIATLLSCLAISYGLAKFYMGALGDRVSIRKLFAGCLALSAIICIIIGFFHGSFYALAILLILCGAVQGALAPASQQMLNNFYPNKTRGAAIAGWNISQNVGGATLPLIIASLTSMGLVVPAKGKILNAFLIPGIIVLLIAFFAYRYGGDTPEDEGLDSLRTMYGNEGETNVASEQEVEGKSYFELIKKYVFFNPTLLLVSLVNVALYFIRFGIEDWMPIYLSEVANMSQTSIQMSISILEWIAIPGSLIFAWIAVKFPNKMAKAGALGLFLMAGFIMVYEYMAVGGVNNYLLFYIVCGILGGLIYGPQLIVNILTLDFVPPQVAGTAIGYVGLMAYLLGNIGANWIMPLLADNFGWFWSYVVIAGLSIFSAIGYLILSKEEETVL